MPLKSLSARNTLLDPAKPLAVEYITTPLSERASATRHHILSSFYHWHLRVYCLALSCFSRHTPIWSAPPYPACFHHNATAETILQRTFGVEGWGLGRIPQFTSYMSFVSFALLRTAAFTS